MNKLVLSFMLILLNALCSTSASGSAANPPAAKSVATSKACFADRKVTQAFIEEMHKKHGLDQKHLTHIFQQYNTEEKVLELISKQYEAMPWYKYRERIVTEERARNGVIFWKENRVALAKAEKEYGVPAEIIIAIIGVESNYGQNTGKFPVVQALSTLAFDYPRRATFFREELEHFLLLSKEGALDPIQAKGSFAGAMGIPQFMPSSYRRYAVDFSGSGKRDLLHDTMDVIGSVANYFRQNGWRTGEGVVIKAKAQGKKHQSLATNKDPKPNMTLTQLAQYQVSPQNPKAIKDKTQKIKFLSLENKQSKEHWMALQNFYVITRYNHSNHYAMAVYQLSQRIRALK